MPQLAPELETPEERAVVVALVHSRLGLRRVGVGADVRKRALENVILPDAEHERVEAALENPVDLLLPVVESPVLRLEAREAAMREVADGTVFEVRLLIDIKT